VSATGRGVAILAWMALWSAAAGVFAEVAGLKYAERSPWPTDLFAFAHAGFHDIDVAVLGSSKASFGLSPSAIDRCMSPRVGRNTRTVNLAKMYATASTMASVARDLLDGERTPGVLVLGLEPEAVNAWNPHTADSVPNAADAWQVPRLLAGAWSWSEAVAALHVLVRGPERVAIAAAGAGGTDARLRWHVIAHGGGQWCYGSWRCKQQNALYEKSEASRWDQRVKDELPVVRDQRYGTWRVGSGVNHEALVGLLSRAKEEHIRVVLVDMPVHDVFRAEVPEAVASSYAAYLETTAAAWGATVWHGQGAVPGDERKHWIDPEHVGPTGAQRLGRALCQEVLAGMVPGPPRGIR
jgi:hypothetical protein